MEWLDNVWATMTAFFAWIPWTWQTASFFTFIACLLIGMTLWELRSPGGAPRRGGLALDTTRGDRLLHSLLGSAFIHLAWLGFLGTPLWGAVILSIVFALAVFRWL